jgi:SNF2 family DNA or RNA helicase
VRINLVDDDNDSNNNSVDDLVDPPSDPAAVAPLPTTDPITVVNIAPRAQGESTGNDHVSVLSSCDDATSRTSGSHIVSVHDDRESDVDGPANGNADIRPSFVDGNAEGTSPQGQTASSTKRKGNEIATDIVISAGNASDRPEKERGDHEDDSAISEQDEGDLSDGDEDEDNDDDDDGDYEDKEKRQQPIDRIGACDFGDESSGTAGDDNSDRDDDQGTDGDGNGDDADRDIAQERVRVRPPRCTVADPTLVDKARRGDLTIADVEAIDPTDALRLAIYDEARPIIERWWGHRLRGLPMVVGPHAASPYALLPHQIHAMRWMRAREALDPGRHYGVAGGILSLRMGMGKTLTALAHILSAPRGSMPTLVLCSRLVLKEWHISGVDKFFGATNGAGAPRVRALYFHRDFMTAAAMRAIDRNALAQYDIVLTTYDVCLAECRRGHYDEDCLERGPKGRVTVVHAKARARADRPDLVGGAVLYGTPWERIVCDESQRFANPTTSIYRAVMALYGRYKWCLTGTPIRNSHIDIWAQMRYLGYTGIVSRAVWRRDGPNLYVRHRLSQAVLVMGYDEHPHDQDSVPAANISSQPLPSSSSSSPSLSSPLPPLSSLPTPTAAGLASSGIAAAVPANNGLPLARGHPTAAAIPKTLMSLPKLPPIRRRRIMVALSAPERMAYDAVLALARSTLDDMRAQTGNFACVLSMFTRLRQVAIASHLMMLGDGTSSRDDVMRGLRQVDEIFATTGTLPSSARAHAGDPGARPASLTPGATLDMEERALVAPVTETASVTPHKSGPLSAIPNATLPAAAVVVGAPLAVTAAGTKTTTMTSTIVRGGSTRTVVTTVPVPSPPAPHQMAAQGSDGDTLRVTLPRQQHHQQQQRGRRLPESMAPTAPQIEIVDETEIEADSERAADDAREAGMGLAMWCLDRRSRAGTRSAKMRALTRILAAVPADEKVLVFSSFVSCLDLAIDAISERLPGLGTVQIDGETTRAERDERLRAFRSPGGPRVLLMTYKVGSEGLNLAEANHCIFMEPWWTKAVEEQAESRCRRVGQTRPVTVYSLIASGTMEQRIVQVCLDKSAMAAAYLASSSSSSGSSRGSVAARRAGTETTTLDLATILRIIG